MAEKIKYLCELCKKEITKNQVSWAGSFIVCDKCNKYLKKKQKDIFKEG